MKLGSRHFPQPPRRRRIVQQRIITMTNRNTKFSNADGRQLLTGLSQEFEAPCCIARCMREKKGRNDASSTEKALNVLNR